MNNVLQLAAAQGFAATRLRGLELDAATNGRAQFRNIVVVDPASGDNGPPLYYWRVGAGGGRERISRDEALRVLLEGTGGSIAGVPAAGPSILDIYDNPRAQ